MEYESKLVVPNKWDNSVLDLCKSIGELVEPPHKKIFQNSSLLSLFLFDEIMFIYFFKIIYKMYMIIDNFVYFDHFCYTN